MKVLRWYVGKKWTKGHAPEQRHWWTSPRLSAHISRQISEVSPTGAPGLLKEAAGDRTLALGISVGAGNGAKEMQLLKTGCIEQFHLYEVAAGPIEEGQSLAVSEGLSDCVKFLSSNAFEEEVDERYDLVYWDHALHHMFDVDAALKWSAKALRPGGILLVNEFVGPTRLQWRRAEIDRARDFIRANAQDLAISPESLRYSTVVGRLRQFLRDPSEAPQSDLIEDAFHKNFDTNLKRIGGTMIHLCAGVILAQVDDDSPLIGNLIEADLAALQDGFSHFAAGFWTKPGA